MPILWPVPCPMCGNTTLEKVSERRGDEGGYFAPSKDAELDTIYVYRCKCGTTFSFAVRNGPPKQSP
jgi:hypothetical protein